MVTIENIPILFNSFIKRKHFLDICLYFYGHYFPKNEIYLTLDEENYTNKNTSFTLLTYPKTEKTSEEMHLDLSRFYRHYYTLNYFKDKGYKYIMNCMDDGWIGMLVENDLNKSIEYLEEYKADRIDLCGPQPEYQLDYVKDNLYIVNSNNTLPWYLTNQCAIWNINSLIQIYEKLGPSSDCDVEKYGSELCRQLNYKFLTFKNSPLDNDGVFQRNVGLKEKGIILLKEYCKQNKINYDEELQKFNKFI